MCIHILNCYTTAVYTPHSKQHTCKKVKSISRACICTLICYAQYYTSYNSIIIYTYIRISGLSIVYACRWRRRCVQRVYACVCGSGRTSVTCLYMYCMVISFVFLFVMLSSLISLFLFISFSVFFFFYYFDLADLELETIFVFVHIIGRLVGVREIYFF